jgi:hypothetical protein
LKDILVEIYESTSNLRENPPVKSIHNSCITHS